MTLCTLLVAVTHQEARAQMASEAQTCSRPQVPAHLLRENAVQCLHLLSCGGRLGLVIPVALEKQAEETLTERGSRWQSETGNKGNPLIGAPSGAAGPSAQHYLTPEAATYK